MKKILTIVALVAAASGPLSADVKLPAIISDHMVLERSAKVPLWGWADPGEDVKISLNGTSAAAKADAEGKWIAVLDLKDSPPGPFEMSVEGKNKISLADVLVGEVWIASGQSNMELRLRNTRDAEQEIASSANPFLRQFLVEKNTSATPLDELKGRWTVAGPETAGDFSAVGYYFGKSLQSEVKVPVGIVNSSWGGTPSEAWTSLEALDSDPDLKAASERIRKQIAEYPGLAKAEQEFPPVAAEKRAAAPKPPAGTPPGPQDTAGFLYNAMIHPIINYAISGAIWYQGESNAGRAIQYRKAFPLLISDWRKQWGRGDFPFYFCQLANFMPKNPEPEECGWAELREAQSLTLALPATGQAVLIDIGESGNIHPRNKKSVGERLARIALAKEHGKKIAFSGPVFDSMKIENGTATVTFRHTDGGLAASPLPEKYDVKSQTGESAPLVRNSPNSQLEGFAICGQDKKWFWADAKIEGDAVVVRSDKVPSPVAVRYAWAQNPTCNLANGAGLPASPFRTDDFPAVTAQGKY